MAAAGSRNKRKAEEYHPRQPPPALTQADRVNLRFLWGKMFEEAEETGRLVLIKFFEDYPESKQYFRSIPTEGSLHHNRFVAFHGRRVMVAMNQVVENLNNWPQACKLLDSLADAHKNTHHAPVGMFQAMFRVMLSICQDLLQKEFTDEMLVSWEKLIGAMYQEILATYSRD